MPDKSYEKSRPNIFAEEIRERLRERRRSDASRGAIPDYAELQTYSNFSFLRGASHAEELVSYAAALGYRALAITDLNSLAGTVRAHLSARELGFQSPVGCTLQISITDTRRPSLALDPLALLVFPTDRRSYGSLCRLLTLGNRRVEKGRCLLHIEDLLTHGKGLATVLLPPWLYPGLYPETQSQSPRMKSGWDLETTIACSKALREIFNPADATFSIAFSLNYGRGNSRAAAKAQQLAAALEAPLVVTNDIHYHIPARRPLQDLLTCIRHGVALPHAGKLLFQHGERYLKDPSEIARLYRDFPQALRRTLEICERTADFSLDMLRYEYPHEVSPVGMDVHTHLRMLVEEGARERYRDGVPERVQRLLEDELHLIRELGYEKYFLTCHDIVRFARSRTILCQGRGAAANSAVCFVLGITAVDPTKIDLLFARFISKERHEPPDIDIDFEHERREEVIQYIYEKYGRDRAGLVATVVTYRHRSAVREIAKAFGLAPQVIDELAKSIHRWSDCRLSTGDLRALGLNPGDTTIRSVISLSQELVGFPRHLSQHPGGFVISQHPLCETVPILNTAMPLRTMIEWDKDDIDTLGMLKIDVLALGMLTCIRKTLALVNERLMVSSEQSSSANQPTLELHSIPDDDPATYEMIRKADTIGVFQIESRAQMSMLPRLQPRCFYDLVIEVAIVRPGPIQGNMVHPFLKRRNGEEKFECPDARVAEVLGKTLGVPLFQEQAMRLAIVLANFSPGEAEQLRRAMAAWKRNKEMIATFQERIIKGIVTNGYPLAFAETCMEQIKGFSEYGFPESHAASFALLAYASAWLKCHKPAEFLAAILNSQPMGFYSASQLIQDGQRHGVCVLPVDINASEWDCTLEEHAPVASAQERAKVPHAVRLGMRLVRGVAAAQAQEIALVRSNHGRIQSVAAIWQHAAPTLRKRTLRLLAQADAFQSLGIPQRRALWEIAALPQRLTPIEASITPCSPDSAAALQLPELSAQQSMFSDYRSTGFSLRAHPLQFVRAELARAGVLSVGEVRERYFPQWRSPPNRRRIMLSIAGIAIIRQRPGTACGVVFITLEDETGVCNLIIRPQFFERYRREIVSSSVLAAYGVLQFVGEIVYLETHKLHSIDPLLLKDKDVNFPNRSYSY